ncbi:MAG: adenosylcobinamide-GDP ribazoletransferase [Coriobacteriia bacterium]
MRALRDISAAFSWLTVVPSTSYDGARPARYFPLVGWAFGLGGLAIALGASIVVTGSIGSLLVGLLVVFVWALGSKLLHWDGMGDTVDGLWGGRDVESKLAIMHDSRMGSFGVVAISLTLLAQVIAVSAVYVSGDWWAIAAAPVLGRLSASIALWTMHPARPDGLAAHLSERESPMGWLIALATAAVVFIAHQPEHIVLAGIGIAFGFLVPRILARPVRGITGDIIGASVVIVETTVLIGAALIAGV